MKKRPVRTALALTALAAIVPLSGCAAILSAQQTAGYAYNGGDGQWTEEAIDGVQVRGMLLLQNEEGDAQLFYTLLNSSDQPRTVSIDVSGTEFEHTLPAGEKFEQNPEDPTNAGNEPEIVEGLDVVIGELTDVEVSVGAESQTLRVQVLDDSLPYYDGLLPTSAPTDLPTEDAGTEGTESPEEDGAGAEGSGAEGAGAQG